MQSLNDINERMLEIKKQKAIALDRMFWSDVVKGCMPPLNDVHNVIALDAEFKALTSVITNE